MPLDTAAFSTRLLTLPCFISFESVLTNEGRGVGPHRINAVAMHMLSSMIFLYLDRLSPKTNLQTPRHTGYSDIVPNMQSIVYVRSFLALTSDACSLASQNATQYNTITQSLVVASPFLQSLFQLLTEL